MNVKSVTVAASRRRGAGGRSGGARVLGGIVERVGEGASRL